MAPRGARVALLAVLGSSGCGVLIGLEDHGLLGDAADASSDAAIDGTAPPDGTTADDAVGPADAPGDGPGFDAAGPTANRIFVTSSVFPNAALGGSAGADDACKAHALDAGLDGSFVALISTSTQGLGARIAGARGWVRVDGRAVADTPAQLVAGEIWYPVALDEHGATPKDSPFVATGSSLDGGVSQTCADWTAGDAAAYTCGNWPAGYSAYLYGGGCSCNTPFRLYCLETTHHVQVSPPQQKGRLAFVSQATLSPDGGLGGADGICVQEAALAQLDGGFHALLATSQASAASRFDVSSSAPTWVRSDGVPIFASAADMPTDKIEAPVVFSATGARIGGAFVWAGGKNAGDVGGANTCGNWTGSGNGIMGTAGTVRGRITAAPAWFGNYPGTLPCSFAGQVYCFQE